MTERTETEKRIAALETATEVHSTQTTLQHEAITEALEHLDGCVDGLKQAFAEFRVEMTRKVYGFYGIAAACALVGAAIGEVAGRLIP